MKHLSSLLLLSFVVFVLTGCGGNQAPTASITAPKDNETSRELSVRFSADAKDPEAKTLTYAWDFGDGKTGAEASPTHAYAKGGAYTVKLTVTDDANQAATATVAFKVNDPPKATASITSPTGEALSNLLGEAPLAVNFDGSASSDDSKIAGYAWDFGDGTASSEASPQHTFEQPGAYTITLTVNDDAGVPARTTVEVTVTEPAAPPPSDLSEAGVQVVHLRSDGDKNYFDPAFVRIKPGEKVRWVNESGVHATASYSLDNQKGRGIPEGAGGWNSGLLTDVGATFEVTFTQEGTYAYFCLPHESLGMVGVVVVGDGPASVSQDFLNGLQFDAVRQELAKQIGSGTGGVIYTITMTDDNVFTPAVLKVKPGDSIKWVNAGAFPHTSTSYHPDLYGKALGIPEGAAGWDSGMLDGGKEWIYTIPAPAPAGTYAYFCLPHEALGMVGMLIVDEYAPMAESFISALPQSAQDAFKALMEEAAKL